MRRHPWRRRSAAPAKSFGPVRSSLIKKGMIFVPTYAQTAFTVPLFDDFMRPTMPDAVA